MLALEGEAEGLSHREIAVSFWGRERVEAEYTPDGWMHSRIKRRLRRAKAVLKDCRALAAGG